MSNNLHNSLKKSYDERTVSILRRMSKIGTKILNYLVDQINSDLKMIIWRRYALEARIRNILESVPEEGHHFDPRFLTAYQIAIEFNRLYPEDANEVDNEVGGSGSNQHHSLAQYIARELSSRIRRQEILDIEGAFLSLNDCTRLVFSNQDGQVVASPNDKLSIFRIIER